jgi:histidyl-tRNA synthetase
LGLIFEVLLLSDNNQQTTHRVVIGGGGEYNNDSVGFSIGLDRCLSVEELPKYEYLPCQRFILAVDNKSISVALAVANEIKKQHMNVDIIYLETFKQIRKQFGELKKQYPGCLCAILAENELKQYYTDKKIVWK